MATLTKSWQKLGEAFIGSSGGSLYVRLYARYTSQEITNNRTYVEYEARSYYTGSYILDQQGYMAVSGTNGDYKRVACTKPTQGETVSVKTGGWVTHNADGTKTVSGSADLTFPNWGWYNGVSANATLPTIPRASSITVTDANIGSASTITINKASSGFTTTLYYKASDESSWTKIVDKTSNNSWGWTVPTSFYAKIPNTKTIKCSFYAETYSGSTKIGDSSVVTATFTATGNPSMTASSIVDSNSTTVALTGNNIILVKYKSNALITVQAKGNNSATISKITVNNSNMSLSTSSGTTTGTLTINKVATNVFTINITDSRGYVTTVIRTLGTDRYVNYIPVMATATVARNQPTDGKVNITVNGSYYNGSIGATANTLTVSYRYKQSGGSFGSWTNLTRTLSGNTYNVAKTTISNIDYTKQYVFEIRAVDKLQTTTVTNITVTKGQPVFWWDANNLHLTGELRLDKTEGNRSLYNDVNSINTTSIYRTDSNATGVPMGGTAGTIITLRTSNNYRTQFWVRYRDNLIYIRQFNTVNSNSDGTNPAWSNWQLFFQEKQYSMTSAITTNELWVDGKIIYQRVYPLTKVSANTEYNFDLSSWGIDNVIEVKGFISGGSQNFTHVPIQFSNSWETKSNYAYIDRDKHLRVKTSWDASNAYIIIKYTKA